MRIVALDLSLTQTGHASCDGRFPRVGVLVPPKKVVGMPRLAWIRGQVLDLVAGAELVVLEGYSFGSPAAATRAHSLGELGGVVRLALWEAGVPFVDLAPKTVKKLATGKGTAGKEEVLVAAVRRLGYEGSNNNEADALWLLEAALQAHGSPTAELPKTHRDALAGVSWPTLQPQEVAA